MAKGKNSVKVVNNSGIGAAFFIATIGAAIYFVQQSFGFWGFILALLKALVWPAYLIHATFKLLGI